MRILIALMSALALTLVPTMPAQADSVDASMIVGTWKGTYSGYEGGEHVTKEAKWVITKSRGTAFTGTKTWRLVGGAWSAPERLAGVLLPSGDVRWTDEDGYFIGVMENSRSIRGTYMEAGADQAVYDQRIRKIK